MRVPYGLNKEFFKYSLFLVFCNRLTTSAVSAGALLVITGRNPTCFCTYQSLKNLIWFFIL